MHPIERTWILATQDILPSEPRSVKQVCGVRFCREVSAMVSAFRDAFTAVPTKADSVMLGFEKDKGKGMVYILPGGDAAPVEIWDYVVTPVPRRAKP